MVEWVKRSTLRWFGHIERMGNEKFVKKVYLSSVEGTNRREGPLLDGKIGCRSMRVRGMMDNALEWARRECMDRERWRSICRGHPLGGCFQRE